MGRRLKKCNRTRSLNRRAQRGTDGDSDRGEYNGVLFPFRMIRCVNDGPSAFSVRRHWSEAFDRNFTHSDGGAVVVDQHATQALVPPDWSRGHKAPRLWNDQPIAPRIPQVSIGSARAGRCWGVRDSGSPEHSR